MTEINLPKSGRLLIKNKYSKLYIEILNTDNRKVFKYKMLYHLLWRGDKEAKEVIENLVIAQHNKLKIDTEYINEILNGNKILLGDNKTSLQINDDFNDWYSETETIKEVINDNSRIETSRYLFNTHKNSKK